MATKPFSPEQVIDGFAVFTNGMNSGVVPRLNKPTELAKAVNATVRGGYPASRPPYVRRVLNFGSDSVLTSRFQDGRFQGAAYYQPDSGPASLISSHSGRLFKITIPGFNVQEITINHTTSLTVGFPAPAVNGTTTIQVLDTSNLAAGLPILIRGKNYTIVSVDSPTQLTVKNIDDIPGVLANAGDIVTFWDVNPSVLPQAWLCQAEKWMIVQDGQSVPVFYNGATARRSNPVGNPPEISTGRMAAYWLGRYWWALPDPRTFRAGDIVYSSSGTAGERFRDAVLKQAHNTFLLGGGDFTTPSNMGEIRAMRPVAVLDASLGQGPLQVLTPNGIFNCTAPVDETLWASVTNPILGMALLENGGLSQWATILANGDMIYRSLDGIRSLILGRRDFATWGNTPISSEMAFVLTHDDNSLLQYCSAIIFDNRLLMTCSQVFSQHGIYHRGLIALDFNVISGIRDKLPAVYDGLWTGLNVLQLVKGIFNGVERAFAYVLTGASEIELWEFLPSLGNYFDNENIPIIWSFETGDKFTKTADQLKQLSDGEIWVDDIVGRVDFKVFWKPDQYSCWIPWHAWSVCSKIQSCETDLNGCYTPSNFKPQYRSRMGLGEPPNGCDPITNKIHRNFFTCQVRVQVQGHCRILGMKLRAITVDDSTFAPMICNSPDCDVLVTDPQVLYWNEAQSYTAFCPPGEIGDSVTKEIAANIVNSTVSQEDANSRALQIIQAQASRELVCSEPVECNFELDQFNYSYSIDDFLDGSIFTGCAVGSAGDPAWDGTFKFNDGSEAWGAGTANTLSMNEVGFKNAYLSFDGCIGEDMTWRITILCGDGSTMWTGTKLSGINPEGVYSAGPFTPTPPTVSITLISDPSTYNPDMY
jgi:hypothetical protein